MAASMVVSSSKFFHSKLAFNLPRKRLPCQETAKVAACHLHYYKSAFGSQIHGNSADFFATLKRPCSYRTRTADAVASPAPGHVKNVQRQSIRNKTVFSSKLDDDGRSLKDFINASNQRVTNEGETSSDEETVPYLHKSSFDAKNRNVYFETYGCQMNVNDTEIAWAILQQNGFQKVDDALKADVILAVTCAIRENAEQKIWNRLEYFQALKKRRRKGQPPLKVGLLGCMAERLKKEILERSKIVDIVAGPDAYRDLPRLLSVADSGQAAINVMLSADETYADVIPVRLSPGAKSAFISIMRGCDNMCSYCIVPFTRGRERSRPLASILDEVRILSNQGVKEITLLGQNVNSYRDTSEAMYYGHETAVGTDSNYGHGTAVDTDPNNHSTPLAKGFSSIYKHKKGGLRFADLLDQVSTVDPEMRIRFTSPHPKDFPDEVLHVIRDRDNVCKQIHMPAQSGSTEVLERMRRGYTREAYLDLVDHIRSIIPQVSLSSDFITGFCGETETEHDDTLSLLRLVRYNYAFLFAYSMRKKTHAYHRMTDDVPEDVKQRRLREVIAVCREIMQDVNASQIGQRQVVLIEGTSKRSDKDIVGRNDGNIKVIIPGVKVPYSADNPTDLASIHAGDYVVVQIDSSNSQVLKGTPVCHTTLQDFNRKESQMSSRTMHSSEFA